MTPHIAVFDDFMPKDLVDQLMHASKFESQYNPGDGLTYEGISTTIPLSVIQYVQQKIFGFLDEPRARINHMFVRLMTETTPPSNVHIDRVMGQFSLHVYLSPGWHSVWGTQFWANRKYGTATPDARLPFDPETVNRPCDWDRTTFVAARFNRALIHDSSLWHSAEPAGGFGTGPDDGRLVFTTFFSRCET